VLQLLGILFASFLFIHFGKEIFVRVAKPTDWQEYKGDWAVITGSSYGIGRSFALELARRGLNVILTARTKSKLDEVAKEINTLFPSIQVKILVQDVIADPEWNRVASEIAGLNISVLVNNVGGGNLDGTLKKLHEYPASHHDRVHQLNFQSTKGWTLLLLPRMYERRKGRILSCSSMAWIFGYKESVYGADKGAVQSLTYTINNEYSDDGIRAEALVIGVTSTPALGSLPEDWMGFVTSSDSIATSSLDQFGWFEVYSPTLGHAFFYFMGWALPTSLRALSTKGGTENLEKAFVSGREEIHNIQNKKDL